MSAEDFVSVARSFVDVVSIGRLTISLLKTERMSIAPRSSFEDGVPVCNQSVEMVKEFPYLGSIISNDGEVDSETFCRK